MFFTSSLTRTISAGSVTVKASMTFPAWLSSWLVSPMASTRAWNKRLRVALGVGVLALIHKFQAGIDTGGFPLMAKS